MPRAARAMIAKTAHSQSLPPAVMWRSAFGGFWSREDPAMASRVRARSYRKGKRGTEERLGVPETRTVQSPL